MSGPTDWLHAHIKAYIYLSFSVEPRGPYLGAKPAVSSDLHKQILRGYLTVKADVVSVEDSSVQFSDGTKEDDIDIIVVATGYDYT